MPHDHCPRATAFVARCARWVTHHGVLLASLVLARMTASVDRRRPALTRRGDPGQATTEYALVLLGAAMVALLLVAWATSGGGSGRIGRLLDSVLDAVSSKV